MTRTWVLIPVLVLLSAAGAAPVSLAQSPPVPSTQILDDFNRPDENPVSQSGNWSPTAIAGNGSALRLVGQRLVPSNARTAYREAELPADMEAYYTVAVGPAPANNQRLYIGLQDAGTPAFDGYSVAFERWSSGFRFSLARHTDGVATPLGLTNFFQAAIGDRVLLRRIGTTIEAWYDRGGTWSLKLSVPNQTMHAGPGRIGVGFGGGGAPGAIDDVGGGPIGGPPPPAGPPLEQSRGICGGAGVHAIATSRCLSDPVNTLTGAFVTSVEDLSVPGTGVGFAWSRSYTSSDPTSGRLGVGWTDSYAASLHVEPNGDVRLHGDEGQIVRYKRQPDGSFRGAPGARSTLSAVAGGYELVRMDHVVYRFMTDGRLVSMKDRNGQGLTLAYDGLGRLSSISDAAGRRTTFAHDASGLLAELTSDDGRRVAYGYTDGRLTSVTDIRGKTWRYTYDGAGRLATIVDPLGHAQVTNVYDADGRVLRQTDAIGNSTSFAWNESTQTASITDANGKTWTDDYEENVLAERVDALENATGFEHDAELNTTAVSSPGGDTTTLAYDARGNLLSATAPASLGGARKTFAYNARNDPTEVTDARGTVTSYAYDIEGNLTQVVQAGTPIASYTHDAAGRVLTSSDGNSKITTYTYDGSGNLASETDPLGNKTTYTYDVAGRITTRVDPKGNVPGANPADFTWRWTYDAAGHVLTERDPLGAVTTHTYDDAGNELTVTDAGGRTTTFSYDAGNRLEFETGPDADGGGPLPAPVTEYDYDEVGNKVAQIDALGRTTTFSYDSANRLVSTTQPDPDGAGPLSSPVTTNTYDDNGNIASTVEPRGNVPGANPDEFRTRFAYDAAGRLLTTTDPLGNTTTNVYDAVGNLASVRDANGHTTGFTHDGAGRITTVTAPDGGVTTYAYDGAGNRVSRRDANDHVTTYANDDAGRLVTETRPDPDGPGPKSAPVTTHTYDANGNQTSTVDANGNATPTAGDGRTSYAYDKANRLVAIDYSDTTPDVTFSYDAVGNRVSMTDGSGTEARAYDGLNRLTSVTRGSNTFSYLYDAVGNLTRRTYPGGTVTDNSYDALGRLASVTTGGQTTSYAYDAASNLVQTTLPAGNGHVESRVYDRAGRLTEVTTRRGATTLASFVATLDAVGNPTQIVRTGAWDETQTYTYDPNDRLVSACFQAGGCPGAQDPFVRWTYDRVGNRLSEQRPTGTVSYSYDAGDRLTRLGSFPYTYDENGNQLSGGRLTFTYDLANRLRTVGPKPATTTYSYDGDGIRLEASAGTSPSQKTSFLWDVNHPLPQLTLERNGSGSLLRQYTYGARRISMTSGSTTSFYHYDGLGSVANMTSSTGSRLWTYSYEPFGLRRIEQHSDVILTNFMTFTGEYLDPTGHYHLRARQYDAGIGRFQRPDPAPTDVESPLTATYVYASNRPTVFVDPSGLTLQPVDDSRQVAELTTSIVIPELPPFPCALLRCPRPPRPAATPRLVHPIPAGYPASSGPVHPTDGLPGYPALDFFPPANTPVLAVQSGVVYRLSGNNPRRGEVGLGIWGWSLYLRADSGSDFYYTHLGTRIGLGRVRAGQVIGTVGRWIRPDGTNKSHLHLGVHGGPVTVEMLGRAPRVRR